MPAPLNPVLHRALVVQFRHVLISNEGMPFVGTFEPNPYRPGRLRHWALQSGEYYRVSCPFCNDTTHRLYINHMFNVRMNGDDHLYLTHCFNEQCIDSRRMQNRLLEMIFPFGYGDRQTPPEPRPGPTVSPQPEQSMPIEVRLPPTFPLQDPVSAIAWKYLLHRGFDPQEISDRWGVTYCLLSPNVSPRIDQRIVIPIYHVQQNFAGPASVVLAGWQAREVTSTASGAKYLSMRGMRKSRLLYGLPQAVQTSGPVVIVEGATDVWRLGSNAVALFGKSISPDQSRLINLHFSNRPLVVGLDRDATVDAQRVLAELRRVRSEWNNRQPVVVCHAPDGAKDFGDVSREAAWAAIWAALS